MNKIKVASELVKLAKSLLGAYGINPKKPTWSENIPRDARWLGVHFPAYIHSALSNQELKRIYKFVEDITEDHDALLTHVFMTKRSGGDEMLEVAWWVKKDDSRKMYSELKRKLPLDNEYMDDVKFFSD